MTSKKRENRLYRRQILRFLFTEPIGYVFIALAALFIILGVTKTMGYESRIFQGVLAICFFALMGLLVVLVRRRYR